MQHLLTAMTDREETMDQEVREGDEGMEGDDSDDSIHYEDVDTEEEASGEEEEEQGAEEGEEEESMVFSQADPVKKTKPGKLGPVDAGKFVRGKKKRKFKMPGKLVYFVYLSLLEVLFWIVFEVFEVVVV